MTLYPRCPRCLRRYALLVYPRDSAEAARLKARAEELPCPACLAVADMPPPPVVRLAEARR